MQITIKGLKFTCNYELSSDNIPIMSAWYR